MNTGVIVLLIAVIFVVYLAATGRLSKTWTAIKGG